MERRGRGSGSVTSTDAWSNGDMEVLGILYDQYNIAWYKRNSDLVTICSDTDSDAQQEQAQGPVDSKLRVQPELRSNLQPRLSVRFLD